MPGPNEELVFAPLGGVGEIGMNLALYGIGSERSKQWLIVDFGVAFAGDDLPGVDLIMPDIAYLIEERRNIAGILIEGEGTPVAVAIGIGINCATHPDDTEFPATDLREQGVEATPEGLLAALSAALGRRLTQWDRGANFASTRADWLARAHSAGRELRVRLAERELSGRFESLDDAGRLLLRLPDGSLEVVTGGDVFAIGRTGRSPPAT